MACKCMGERAHESMRCENVYMCACAYEWEWVLANVCACARVDVGVLQRQRGVDRGIVWMHA